jgi:hypothetical protein
MALLNAAGQALSLFLSPTQLSDVTQGLKPGDLLRGRVVDLFSDGKALVNLRGVNVVAELAGGLASDLQKGDVLQLAVRSAPTPQGQPASPGQGQLTLQVLSLLNSTGAAQLQSQTQASSNFAAQTASIPAGLEELLSQAGIPSTSANLTVARALLSQGLPVTAQAVQQVLDQANQLLAGAPAGTGTEAAQAPPQSAVPSTAALQTVRNVLVFADQQNPPVQTHLQIQTAIKLLDQASARGLDLSQPLASFQADPAAKLPALVQALEAVLPHSTTPATPVQSDPVLQPQASALPDQARTPGSVGTSASAIIPGVESFPGTPQRVSPDGLSTSLLASAASTAGSETSLPPSARSVLTSTLLEMIQPSPAQPAEQSSVLQAALQVLSQLSDPGSPLASQMLQAAQASTSMEGRQVLPPETAVTEDPGTGGTPQAPTSVQVPSQEVLLASARDLVAGTVANLRAQPLSVPAESELSLTQTLQGRGLGQPDIPLASLPREAVLEAVVFLQARDLPVTPSLVAPVANTLALKQAPLLAVASSAAPQSTLIPAESLTRTLTQAAQLPPEVLQASPKLAQAVSDFQQTLENLAVDPEGPAVAQKLEALLADGGAHLEARLALEAGSTDLKHPSAAGLLSPASGTSGTSGDLKVSLLKLRQAVAQAENTPGLPQASRLTLENFGAQVRESLASLTSLQLANLPQPAHESVVINVPIWFGRQILPGQLTVTWRRGRENKLDDKEPVNLVFQLHTRALGEVRVLLQVWKKDCNCRVELANQDALDHVKRYLPDFRSAFESNTPFEMKALDLSLGATGETRLLAGLGPEAPLPSALQALNVSA